MVFKISGLKKSINYLEDTIKKMAKELEGEHSISNDILFDSQFIKKYTNFISWDEMLDKSSFQIKSQEDFDKIQDEDEWSIYVDNNTKFNNWGEMINMGEKEFFSKLGFDKSDF